MDTQGIKDLVSSLRRVIPVRKLRSNELVFERFKQTILLRRSIIQTVQLLLERLQSCKLSARDILAAYMFVFYESDFLTDISSSELEQGLSACALQVVNHVHDGDLEDPGFTNRILLYIKAYEIAYLNWKPINKAAVLEEMCRLYWEYELVFHLNRPNMTTDELQVYSTQKDSRQHLLLKAMKNIDGLRAFSSFAPPVVFESATVDQIKRTLARAFWDMVRDDIDQDPPAMDRVFSVFKDIREKLVCILRSDDNEIVADYDDLLDPGFVAQVYAGTSDHVQFWMQRCDLLIRILVQLDSIVMQGVHEEWWRNVRERAIASHAFSDVIDACVSCLAYFMSHIEDLLELVQKTRTLSM